MKTTRVDVLIVGAGLSGIAAAHALRRRCPGKSFCIVESRQTLGGTWDLFRYPGVRSDSDMYTLGFSFRPWRRAAPLADGATILDYLRDTARAEDLERSIRYGRTVCCAEFRSAEAAWHVEAMLEDGSRETYVCQFLFACTGYFHYAHGHQPEFPGRAEFAGQFVHPQQWPAGLDVTGLRIVVIGSGATAVTLVPALARQAAHVTMLQRSPTYLFAAPSANRLGALLFRWLPVALAYRLLRWWNIGFGICFVAFCRRYPAHAARWLVAQVRRQVGPGVDARHVTPRYDPWTQRLCLVPEGDLFAALRAGRVTIATQAIERLDAGGVVLRDGTRLDADLIVSATGLELRVLGDIELRVDGQSIDPARSLTYKGSLFSDLPNLACAVGYTNASWTLKLELTCRYVCRLLRFMDRQGYATCTPRSEGSRQTPQPWFDLSSGYIQRALGRLPRQGTRWPWRLRANYVLDALSLRYGRISDRALHFVPRAPVPPARSPAGGSPAPPGVMSKREPGG